MALLTVVGASQTLLASSPSLLIALLLLLVWVYHTWKKQSHIPGPLLASISNISRLSWAWSSRAHQIHIRLHEKYGNLVRIGPNCISVGDPHEIDEIQKIYGTGANFGKSDYYKVLQPMSRGKIIQGLFNTQDEMLHRAMKRPIAGIYSMTNLVEFEPYVDTTIQFFLQRLDETQTSSGGKAIDLGTWLQWFAFDVMGEITFSKRLGFLDEATDVEGIMGPIWKVFRYSSVGQMPWLDKLWVKNPYIRRFLPEKNSPVVSFAMARARERTSDTDKSASDYNSKDFMSRFLEARAKDPANIPEWFVTAWTTSNMLAGSDTTAIMLRAIIYFLLKHPASLQKLLEELAQARRENRLSDIVTWKESRSLPYLDACVKEAGRLHPAIGLTLERVVPQGSDGVEICGQHFAPGTIVGMNPWVIHRNQAVFGPDADEWNPDRWLAGSKEQRVLMERCLLTFGSGHRTCIGKNISYLEIYKLIPTMFARYEMQVEKDWNVQNSWLVVQTDLHVRLSQRQQLAL
ncbi:cytochrome P450 monooxygenase [Diplogelasinospora grovesii]|uniref:Cytochrome P450 monooxygenase n=1 Tax=Diplogelasinospora grovesii TaxID=303347 RepID=A0AAN6S766_9PEZI|nr:cytochrome P450 monooxygenase [Diplogelasinospora grovesii]